MRNEAKITAKIELGRPERQKKQKIPGLIGGGNPNNIAHGSTI